MSASRKHAIGSKRTYSPGDGVGLSSGDKLEKTGLEDGVAGLDLGGDGGDKGGEGGKDGELHFGYEACVFGWMCGSGGCLKRRIVGSG